MNIFLCSTVRHVMLSILKSVCDQQHSIIFVICDQQNLEPDDFNTSGLPSNVQVKFIHRKKVLSKVYRGFTGRILKYAAICNFKPTKWLKEKTQQKVLIKTLGLADINDINLYLYNDRNRLSRLLRLSVNDYSVIEDGLSNYSGIKLSFFDKLNKLFTGNNNKYRYIGDNSRCKDIWLLNPDKAPEEVSFKAKSINFIKAKNVQEFCYPFFKMDEALDENVECIIATQPISVGGLTQSNYDLVIYKKLVEKLKRKNKNFVFKVHPRECIERYSDAFPEVTFIKSKIPLELVIFGLKNKSTIYSIYSSAGMGFENFCTRRTIVDESEALDMGDVFDSWKKDEKQLEDRLKSLV